MTAVYRAMSPAEITMAKAVAPGLVSYLPGSTDKRFARTMWASAAGSQRITDKQADYIRRLVWKYRRQIAPAVAALVPANPLDKIREKADVALAGVELPTNPTRAKPDRGDRETIDAFTTEARR